MRTVSKSAFQCFFPSILQPAFCSDTKLLNVNEGEYAQTWSLPSLICSATSAACKEDLMARHWLCSSTLPFFPWEESLGFLIRVCEAADESRDTGERDRGGFSSSITPLWPCWISEVSWWKNWVSAHGHGMGWPAHHWVPGMMFQAQGSFWDTTRHLICCQVGQGLEQPGNSGRCPWQGQQVEWDELLGPFQPKPFWDPMTRSWNQRSTPKIPSLP